MAYFFLGVLLTAAIFIAFRLFSILKVNTLQAIVINYFVCVVTGSLFIGDISFVNDIKLENDWVKVGLGMGVIFITTFYMMAVTTQRVSISAASLASKLSLVMPVTFSLWVLQLENVSPMDYLNYIGLILVFLAIFSTSVKKKDSSSKSKKGILTLLLPTLVFLFSGIIDILFNYANAQLIPPEKTAAFSVFLFFSSGVVGVIILLFTILINKEKFELKSIVGGIALGIPNYFSIYFLLKALNHFNNNGAFLYPIFNMGVIILSTLVGVLLFKEKLSTLNKIGVALAVLAILLISHQEISNLIKI